jgi:hypothetical protein
MFGAQRSCWPYRVPVRENFGRIDETPVVLAKKRL